MDKKNNTLTLKNPIMINGEKVSEMKYDWTIVNNLDTKRRKEKRLK